VKTEPDTGGAAGTAVIFESYGWADAANIARQIKSSLESAGFEVWLDSDHLKPDEPDFWSPLQTALERCKLVIALLSPHSVRLENDVPAASGMSVCHNELIMAVRMKKPVVSVTVIDCEPPLSINHYDPIDLTAWHRSPSAYGDGMREVLHWIREGLAGRKRYRVYVDNLSQDRLSFPEEQTAARGFVGRRWVMERIAHWLTHDERRCFLIAAEPGAGKTALVADLVRQNPDDRILAYHFCNAQREDTVDPRRFIRSLAAMLCATVPDYRARLRSSEALVRALKSDGQPGTMFWQGILEPLHTIGMDGPRYIVLDGLDEAAESVAAGTVSIPRLLSEWTGSFPLWLKLLATTRPYDRVLALFQTAARCELGESVAGQQEDLRHYIDAHVPAGAPERIRLIDALAERSAGNFQYAEIVVNELSGGRLAIGDIDRLPKSLAGLYYNRAEARFPDGQGFAQARLVLSVLLAAREPLTRSQLAAITGLDREDALLPILRKLNCFLIWDPDEGEEGVYRMAHKSVGEWLLAPSRGFDRFKIDIAMGRERLLAHCRNWASHRELYAARNLISHLLEAGSMEEALALVREGFFAKRAHVDPACDLADARSLTLALVERGEAAPILELARTGNVRQRDGVAAALLTAPPAAGAFVDGLVLALLKLR
jgi:hypothetical protein